MKYTFKDTLRACYLGFITLAIVNNLAPLFFVIFHDNYGLSFEKIGRLVLVNFTTQLITDLIAIKYIDRVGYRLAGILSHLFSFIGLIGLAIFPLIFKSPFLGIILAVIIYAIGGGLNEVIISPIVESLPGDAKASTMSLLHSFYCWGQLGVVIISTIFIKLFGNRFWSILPIIWSIIPLYNIFNFIKIPLMPMLAHDEKLPVKKLMKSKTFLIAIVLMVSAGAAELTMSQWASLFAEKGLGVSKMIGDLLGPALFALLMGTGRLLHGFFGDKINLNKALIYSSILCIICYLTTVFSKNPFLGLFSCALCGLSVSLMWPGTLSLTALKFPKGGAAMFAILALFGDLGASLGPWTAGLISDISQNFPFIIDYARRNSFNSEQMGLKAGLFVALIFPIILFLGVLIIKNEKIEEEV